MNQLSEETTFTPTQERHVLERHVLTQLNLAKQAIKEQNFEAATEMLCGANLLLKLLLENLNSN